MTTPTFTWAIDVDTNGSATYRARDVQFGDGYAQSVSDGLNSKLQTWPVTLTLDDTDMAAVIAFLDERAGWQSFNWTPPLGAAGLYKCKGYTHIPHAAGWNTFSAVFVQVFTP